MEEHRMKDIENRLSRKMFGPKRDEVTGEWIELYRTIVLPVALYGCET
jgi:hypothetical protein